MRPFVYRARIYFRQSGEDYWNWFRLKVGPSDGVTGILRARLVLSLVLHRHCCYPAPVWPPPLLRSRSYLYLTGVVVQSCGIRTFYNVC